MGENAQEAELLRRSRAGDQSAFEQLYRANAGRIYAVCLRMTGRPAEAEELTQDVFVRAWQKLDTFEARSRFSSWLHRMAVNLALNERRGRRGAMRENEIADSESLDRAPRPAADAEPTGADIDIDRALLGLSQAARSVFVLHEIHGYRHEEIASMTGMAVGTSKSQLHRARRKLREHFA